MTGRASKGFTIVELLIVVVVIAILAAITIVSYNGITKSAEKSSFAADVANVQKKLELLKVESGTETYPNPAGTTIEVGAGATANFVLASPTVYCASVTRGGKTYAAAKGAPAVEGSCVVNLVKNPKGIGASSGYFSSGWFHPLGTTTDATGVSWGGRADWHRFVWTGAGNGIKRLYVDFADLQGGQAYTASVLVANPGTSTISFSLDFSDQSSTVFSLAPGESRRVSVTGTRATYDSTFRFIDIDAGPTAASGLLVIDPMLTRTDSAVSFGDGGTTGWAWTGAEGASKSTGPAL